MLKNLGTVEFVVIGVIAVLLFGSKKMTDVAKGLGKSTKEFKKAQKEYEKTVNKDVSEEESEESEKEDKEVT